MSKASNTELAWKVEALERKVAATTDLLIFMAAHLAEVAPEHAAALNQQVRALQQIDGAPSNQEFARLLQRFSGALGSEDIDLDSLT